MASTRSSFETRVRRRSRSFAASRRPISSSACHRRCHASVDASRKRACGSRTPALPRASGASLPPAASSGSRASMARTRRSKCSSWASATAPTLRRSTCRRAALLKASGNCRVTSATVTSRMPKPVCHACATSQQGTPAEPAACLLEPLPARQWPRRDAKSWTARWRSPSTTAREIAKQVGLGPSGRSASGRSEASWRGPSEARIGAVVLGAPPISAWRIQQLVERNMPAVVRYIAGIGPPATAGGASTKSRERQATAASSPAPTRPPVSKLRRKISGVRPRCLWSNLRAPDKRPRCPGPAVAASCPRWASRSLLCALRAALAAARMPTSTAKILCVSVKASTWQCSQPSRRLRPSSRSSTGSALCSASGSAKKAERP
mmetsp:Transcript_88913/g.281429  ORF Transcript_88913/g.281429 Transcript_88913/m.281429 type:complete len:378 (-) Transcript_88913:281-1414(-)